MCEDGITDCAASTYIDSRYTTSDGATPAEKDWTRVALPKDGATSGFASGEWIISDDPQLHRNLDVDKSISGLSNYLIDCNIDWKKLLTSMKSEIKCDILLSGAIPPNPTQLLNNGNLDNLLSEAKSIYDYVIVDTPPSLIVSDTISISHLSDLIIYVVRCNYTDKKVLNFLKDLINDKKITAKQTTPDPLLINQLLNQMVDAEVEYCFMEVSSHAISQSRIYGLEFNIGVFSNLTHDHLDYHQTFKNYIDAKKMEFNWSNIGAILNIYKNCKDGISAQNSKAQEMRNTIKAIKAEAVIKEF